MLCALLASLSACTSGGSSSTPPSTPPVITGTPSQIASVGRTYSFQPSATDADGDTLTFGISRQPQWTQFDPQTGRLSGTPASDAIGRYELIAVGVSDGIFVEWMRPFDIDVVKLGDLSITLAWEVPQENEDGSPLLDLAGYRIRYGEEPDHYPNVIEIGLPDLTEYLVEGLDAGTYFFVLSAFNRSGLESYYSDSAELDLR